MSGIAGWIAAPRRAPEAQAAVPMLDALAHRGAGGGLCEFVCRAGGHRVLLGACGGAPAYDRQAGVALAFDGALDNRAELRAQLEVRGYRFEQGGDAELALRAYQHWDKEVARHLRGQFAFVAWDVSKERLFAARDRFGEKPLYLCERDGALYFASEAGALLKAPGMAFGVDAEAVKDYLAHRYVSAPRTLFAGVRKLAPGSFALWQFGRLRETAYWSAPDGGPRPAPAGADPVAGFAGRLDEAVKGQLAQGDCGIFLSGGIDSAVLTALASRHRGTVKTFTLGIAGDDKSELPQAAQVAKHFGTRHHEVVVSRAELAASLPHAVAQRDAPLALPSDLAFFLLTCAAGGNVDTVVSGDGCDEILGGYRRYAAAQIWPGAEPLRHRLSRDQSGWLSDNLLERGERLAAGASLGARAPFVEHRLAEYVSSVPDALRVRGLATKRLLHRAAHDLLPQPMPKFRKLGFRVPAGALLRGELRESLQDHLRDPQSLARQYCEPQALERLLADYLKGSTKNDGILWTLLNLEIWHRTYARA